MPQQATPGCFTLCCSDSPPTLQVFTLWSSLSHLISSDFLPSFSTSTLSSGFTPGSALSTLPHSVLPFPPWPYPLTSVLLPSVFIHHPFPCYFYTLGSFLTYRYLLSHFFRGTSNKIIILGLELCQNPHLFKDRSCLLLVSPGHLVFVSLSLVFYLTLSCVQT